MSSDSGLQFPVRNSANPKLSPHEKQATEEFVEYCRLIDAKPNVTMIKKKIITEIYRLLIGKFHQAFNFKLIRGKHSLGRTRPRREEDGEGSLGRGNYS